jgi:plastocyanin
MPERFYKVQFTLIAKSFIIAILLFLTVYLARASDLLGEIIIAPELSRKALPPAVYDLRGIAVPSRAKGSGASRPFGRVAVWLEASPGQAIPPIAATMRQQDRRFEPDLLVVPAGSKIEFPNLDPIFHNVFSLSRTQSFDLGYYSDGKSKQVVFPREGIVQIYCHVHPEMYGVVIVTSSPWVARPDANGAFSLPDVPPGKHRMVVWQRSSGLIHKTVNIPKTGSLRVQLKLPEENDGQ